MTDMAKWQRLALKLPLMNFVFRTTLIWLLALAIPFQGAMAAAMRCCGPQHHQSQEAGERPLGTGYGPNGASHDHGAHDGHSEHAHDHHAASHSHAVHGGTVAKASGSAHVNAHVIAASQDEVAAALSGQHDAQDGGRHNASPEAGKCSVCASCCTATGLPSQAPAIQAPSFDEVHVVSVGALPPEFTTSGPDRPPRSFLV
jgi:hypothetical protein